MCVRVCKPPVFVNICSSSSSSITVCVYLVYICSNVAFISVMSCKRSGWSILLLCSLSFLQFALFGQLVSEKTHVFFFSQLTFYISLHAQSHSLYKSAWVKVSIQCCIYVPCSVCEEPFCLRSGYDERRRWWLQQIPRQLLASS